MDLRVYAITDSHQECRKLASLLSQITITEKEKNEPFVLIDCGDIFKGIYDKDLCVETYLKFKKLNPKAEVVLTIGNNDFGFEKKDFEYYIETVEKFKKAGINVICSNLKELGSGNYSNIFKRCNR